MKRPVGHLAKTALNRSLAARDRLKIKNCILLRKIQLLEEFADLTLDAFDPTVHPHKASRLNHLRQCITAQDLALKSLTK